MGVRQCFSYGKLKEVVINNKGGCIIDTTSFCYKQFVQAIMHKNLKGHFIVNKYYFFRLSITPLNNLSKSKSSLNPIRTITRSWLGKMATICP